MRITIELGYLSNEQLADLQRLLLESTWLPNAFLRALGACAHEQYTRAHAPAPALAQRGFGKAALIFRPWSCLRQDQG